MEEEVEVVDVVESGGMSRLERERERGIMREEEKWRFRYIGGMWKWRP